MYMNTCQVERSKTPITFTLLPFHSSTLGEIKNNRFGISAWYPQTVVIRAITPQQQRQIADNPLSQRELCVLKMIVDGNSNLAIAQKLCIKMGTVKTHVRNILSKLNVSDRAQAAVVALRSGLVD